MACGAAVGSFSDGSIVIKLPKVVKIAVMLLRTQTDLLMKTMFLENRSQVVISNQASISIFAIIIVNYCKLYSYKRFLLK